MLLQTRIPPGDSTPIHTHRWPSVMFVFAWSDLLRFDTQGNRVMDTRQSAEVPKLMAAAPPASFGKKYR